MSPARYTNAPTGPAAAVHSAGRHDRVGGVLGDGLDRGAGDGHGVERSRVARHQRREHVPGGGEVPRGQGGFHPEGRSVQATSCGAHVAADQGRSDGDARRWPPAPRPRPRGTPRAPRGRRTRARSSAAMAAPNSATGCNRVREGRLPQGSVEHQRRARRGGPPVPRDPHASALNGGPSPSGRRHQQARGFGDETGGTQHVPRVTAEPPPGERHHAAEPGEATGRHHHARSPSAVERPGNDDTAGRQRSQRGPGGAGAESGGGAAARRGRTAARPAPPPWPPGRQSTGRPPAAGRARARPAPPPGPAPPAPAPSRRRHRSRAWP